MNTCRFCKAYDDAHGLALIKYGVRHYAHPDCLLTAKGSGAWMVLHDWQLDEFPYFAAKRAGLAESLMEAIRSRKVQS
jgi:hypothetical protein